MSAVARIEAVLAHRIRPRDRSSRAHGEAHRCQLLFVLAVLELHYAVAYLDSPHYRATERSYLSARSQESYWRGYLDRDAGA